MRPYVEELSRIAPCFVSCHPNAGLPNEFGGYDETPEHMRRAVVRVCRKRLAEHRRRLLRHHARAHPRDRRRGAGSSPRRGRRVPHYSRLSGLEPLTLRPDSNFVIVGERTNVTGSKKFARLVRSGDYDAALEVARDQVANGANVLDVNMDEALLDGEKAMSDLPQPDRGRARNRPRAGDDRQLEVVGDRGRPQVRAGQEHRQFDQPERGRGVVSAAGAARPPLRGGRHRDGLRRRGAGRHGRSQGGHRQAGLQIC